MPAHCAGAAHRRQAAPLLFGTDEASRFEAVEPRHADVHEDGVEGSIAHLFHRLLAVVGDLDAVTAFCKKNSLALVEDNCDALGSLYDGKKTGTFGTLATSSFYPPHHITMGEGGAIYFNSSKLRTPLESFRDWGRDCWCASGKDNTCGKRFEHEWESLPRGYDHKYVYSHIGYNLKPTDIQAAIGRIVGAHLDHRGPVSARALADELGLPLTDVLVALLALDADGAILRGAFTSLAPPARRGGATAREAMAATDDSEALRDVEWCNRRVLARIHRLTLARLRREIEPVSAAALMRFLLRWQRVARGTQLIGADGLARVLEQLQGFETAAGAWERELLPARMHGYDQGWLDQLCLAGQIVWCRLSPRRTAAAADDLDEPTEPAAPDARPARAAQRTFPRPALAPPA